MGLLKTIRSGVISTFQATDRETRTVFSWFTLATVGLVLAIILMQSSLPVTTWLFILLPTHSLSTASFSLKLFAPTVSDTPLNEVRS